MTEKWQELRALAEAAIARDSYPEAEQFLWQAMEEAVGTGSILKVAMCLESLGDLYADLRRYADAEAVYSDCLEKKISAIGLEHPEIAQTFNKLAQIQLAQNKTKECEDNLKQALLINLLSLGLNHRLTTATINSLQQLYQSQGRVFDINEVANWGSVPATKSPPPTEELPICRTCHRTYKGPRCPSCTQSTIAAFPASEEELARRTVVYATRDIRPGTVIALSAVNTDTRLATRSDTFRDISHVLGKSVKNLIPQGQVVRLSDLEDI